MNEIELVIRINQLWQKIYPYLAMEIKELYSKNEGEFLELGPFSGGISIELSKLIPFARITIGEESGELRQYFDSLIAKDKLQERIMTNPTPLFPLAFSNETYDLIIFRGAFFFLTTDIIKEIFRILRKGGKAFVGGGYGFCTPQELIAKIADESKELNYKLGKKWISKSELMEMINNTKLNDFATIAEKGGLWLILHKPA